MASSVRRRGGAERSLEGRGPRDGEDLRGVEEEVEVEGEDRAGRPGVGVEEGREEEEEEEGKEAALAWGYLGGLKGEGLVEVEEEGVGMENGEGAADEEEEERPPYIAGGEGGRLRRRGEGDHTSVATSVLPPVHAR